MDRLALFCRNGLYWVALKIDGKWWEIVMEGSGRNRTWPSVERALTYLGRKQAEYEATYGEPLGWQLDRIPVFDV